MKLYSITVLFFFGLVHGQIPEIPKCSWDDPNLTRCLVEVFDLFRPLLKSGVPGMIPSFEPFIINRLPFETSLMGTKLQVVATDIVARGGTNAIITNFEIDANKETADITVVIPKLVVTADYNAVCRQFFFNVHSAGVFTGTFYDIEVQIKTQGQFDRGYNPQRLIVSDVDVNVSFGKKTTFQLEMTRGDKTAKMGTKLANMVPKRLVMFLLKSPINKAVREMLKKYFNLILEKIPIQHLIRF